MKNSSSEDFVDILTVFYKPLFVFVFVYAHCIFEFCALEKLLWKSKRTHLVGMKIYLIYMNKITPTRKPLNNIAYKQKLNNLLNSWLVS